MADGNDDARTPARRAVFSRRRNDSGFLSDDGMTHEQKMMSMRGNNPHFARAVTHHELIPGHHLQGYMTNRYRPYRERFSHAVLDGRLGFVLGISALGQGISTKRPKTRSAHFSGECTARRAYFFAEFSSRKNDAAGRRRFSRRQASGTNATTPSAKSAVHSPAITDRFTRSPI